jgi:hypothetical protein
MNFSKLQILLYSFIVINLVSFAAAQLQTAVSSQLCGIVDFVKALVFILAIALFLLGGVMYAISHFMPVSMEFRKNLQAWSMGMLVAAVIAVILYFIAQPLITLVGGFGNAVATSSTTLVFC